MHHVSRFPKTKIPHSTHFFITMCLSITMHQNRTFHAIRFSVQSFIFISKSVLTRRHTATEEHLLICMHFHTAQAQKTFVSSAHSAVRSSHHQLSTIEAWLHIEPYMWIFQVTSFAYKVLDAVFSPLLLIKFPVNHFNGPVVRQMYFKLQILHTASQLMHV